MEKREIIDLLAKFVPRTTLFFDVIAAEHCNLNCKGCGSMAPLAEKKFLNLEIYENDLKRLSELSGGIMHHINILGGEPLLHPEIKKIIILTRHYFNYGNIYLVTNRILLPQMDDEFWVICKENNVIVAPTKYPIKVDYDAMEKKADEFQVKYKYYGNVDKYGWDHTIIDIDGNRNEHTSFMWCDNANMCPTLMEGKIFPCPKPRNCETFNKAFDTNLCLMDSDYIDIYKIDSLKEIYDFLAKPIPFCRYCNMFAKKKTNWGISKKEITEWT